MLHVFEMMNKKQDQHSCGNFKSVDFRVFLKDLDRWLKIFFIPGGRDMTKQVGDWTDFRTHRWHLFSICLTNADLGL